MKESKSSCESLVRLEELEEALRRSEELYRSIADVDGNAIIRVDRTGKRTFVSRHWAKMRGLTVAEMLKEPFGAAFAPEDRAKAWQALKEVFDTGRAVSGVVTRQDWGSAGERYMSSTYSPVKDAQGNVVEVQITSYDITEQKRLENELREADRMKDQFLSDIAHELQTPVATAEMSLGFMSNLMADFQNERVQKLMANAVASIEQLEKLVKDLLDLARLQNRRLELRREAIDIGSLLNMAMDRHGPLFAQKGIGFSLGGCPSTLVYVDTKRVQQVLDNLLSNAHKYTNPGGTVTVSALPQDDYVVVSVADTGPGISLEDKARLFRRFERMASDGQAGGIGLGLAISRGIVEMHGGRIWVESEVGRGSTFRFTLPRGTGGGEEGL